MTVGNHACLLHKNAVVIDGHCDTVHLFSGSKGPYVFGERNKIGHIDLPRLQEGGVKLQFFALCIEPEHKSCGALRRTLTLIEHFWRVMGNYNESVTVVQSSDDINTGLKQHKLSVILALEGAEALESREILHIFHRLGLRCVGLTWNHRNLLADGVGVGASAGGMTELGREMVREMNKLGILVDASHLAPRGFYDLLEIAAVPIVVTHANAAGLCPHPRNLSDDQLRALRDTGGVIGINFYPPFVCEDGHADMNRLLDHFCYIAERFGTEILGIGSDFDGISKAVTGLDDVSKLPLVTAGLLKRGFTDEEVSMILGGNFLRVIQKNFDTREC